MFAVWALVIGVLLITMTLSGSLFRRLPVSTAMFYLAAGYALGPGGWGILPSPWLHAQLLERITEVALLISLFAAGLKLGVPILDRRWYQPLRLALISMAMTTALLAAFAVPLLGLSLGAAILLGSILAPTDPVLASEVQVKHAEDRDRLRFGLTGEGGLNDGTAYSFVMLGLGMLGLHDLGDDGWRWVVLDMLWAFGGGIAIGGSLGTLVGKLVVYLRTNHREAVGLDEFLSLGLIALTYGTATLSHASGFLAVFAAGLALQRVEIGPQENKFIPVAPAGMPDGQIEETIVTSPDLASAYMRQAVRNFNHQLERIAELMVVLVVGAMLSHTHFSAANIFLTALLFLVVRPLSVWLGLLGTPVSRDQHLLISWFGIRGIGSVYYLVYAVRHGVEQSLASQLTATVLTAVTASIVLHGISVGPLMDRYTRRKADRSH